MSDDDEECGDESAAHGFTSWSAILVCRARKKNKGGPEEQGPPPLESGRDSFVTSGGRPTPSMRRSTRDSPCCRYRGRATAVRSSRPGSSRRSCLLSDPARIWSNPGNCCSTASLCPTPDRACVASCPDPECSE